MKRLFYFYILLIMLVVSMCHYAPAQSPTSIKLRCPSPNGSVYGQVQLVAIGDIKYTPCPTRSSIFTGNVNFSGATLTGVVTGTGTTNYIPRWTNGASGVLGNTPFSWNGTTYNWNNTALTSTFPMNFVPTSGSGSFIVGSAATAQISLTQALNGQFSVIGLGGIGLNSGTSTLDLGDTGAIGNSTTIGFNDATRIITYNAGSNVLTQGTLTTDLPAINHTVTWNDGGVDFSVIQSNVVNTDSDPISRLIDMKVDGTSRFKVDVGGAITATGNAALPAGWTTYQGTLPAAQLPFDHAAEWNNAGNTFQVFKSFVTDTASAAGSSFINFIRSGTTVFKVGKLGTVSFNRTITASGTTGAQTIDKPVGSVNFAAGAATLVVTNSEATTTSIIVAMAYTNDATCSVKDIERAAGSFTIRMTAACTAETPVGFMVFN